MWDERIMIFASVMEIFPRLIISHLSYNEEIEKMEWNFPRTHQKNILKELEEGRNFATEMREKFEGKYSLEII